MPEIVIIGAGPAGIQLAQALEKNKPALPSDVKITLIDKRDYYYHIVAALRSPVEPQVGEQATIPYDRVFKNSSRARIVKAEATKIDETYVYTDASDVNAKIAYAYLVIATGSSWAQQLNLPNARTEALKVLQDQGADIAAAKKIIVVGGGAVGTELAGEIAAKYSGQKAKDVTLVHRGSALLNDVYPAKLRKNLKSQLESLGVHVLTGISVEGELQAGQVTFSNGQSQSCDLIYSTTGGKPNSRLIKDLDASAVSTNGSVRVEKSLQVVGHPKIFALGDVADLKEQKQVAKIPGHVAVVAMNLVSLIKENKTTKKYDGQRELIIVTVGKKGGAGWLFGWNIGSFMAAMMKSKGLFLAPTRKTLGY
ncbi:putative Amid-like NADH oxidoreductase [Taphrina deformans PYCC 5710]|uniref:Amid-like NADH oxidoreductase n=1 Tax=Taphrina deformans (strain PYCC 5710 / ATCC 11124 / CBS 356.35 / IMI 108563 / JCM 9778 / NBRC 8474) TaxID=1097556 RepID=R4XFH5_TAPDE|nr:putative Amid-like NADH oxidoreductase [Taphrina deformans PYCC 5710]|eukprot:CCG82077.1 putative Amid-like NADH oxidoreductase [Taphrina deformans PYCC 5710]